MLRNVFLWFVNSHFIEESHLFHGFIMVSSGNEKSLWLYCRSSKIRGSRETSWVATALRQAKSTSVFLVSGDDTLPLLWPDNGKCHFRAVAMVNEKQLENVA